jgi:ketosteroid isomerase-like protein
MLGSLSSRGLLGLALALAVGCRPAPAERAPSGGAGGPPLAAEDIAAIRATDSSFAGAVQAGDAVGMAATYLPDAHLLPPNAAPVEGREAIQRFWKGFVDAYQVTFAGGADEIEGRGDLAYARGHYTLEGRPKAAGVPPLHDEGKFVEVLRRQSDGTWRYAVDMYNSNLPIPGAK